MKLNTGKSELTPSSPEYEQVKGPFRADVKEEKVPTPAHHTKLKGSSVISTDPFLTPLRDVPLHRRVTDWQGMRKATNSNKLWDPGSSLPSRRHALFSPHCASANS